MITPTIDTRLTGAELTAWYDNLTLAKGAHDGPDAGMCVMEAIAWIAGDDFNDSPDCVSPVIRSFAIPWQDALSSEDRARLVKPLMWDMAGTNTGSADVEAELAWMATDWLVRVQAPTWLRLAGLTEQADTLAGLPRLDATTTPGIMPALKAVQADSAAARDAAWAAARVAARVAAWAAARDAAWAAARVAARVAAWAAAWDAARAAARDAAWDAAWAAAWDAARAAAWAVAWDAARAVAWDAARDAAEAALKPGVDELQPSAVDLLTRMCAHAKAAQ